APDPARPQDAARRRQRGDARAQERRAHAQHPDRHNDVVEGRDRCRGHVSARREQLYREAARLRAARRGGPPGRLLPARDQPRAQLALDAPEPIAPPLSRPSLGCPRTEALLPCPHARSAACDSGGSTWPSRTRTIRALLTPAKKKPSAAA